MKDFKDFKKFGDEHQETTATDGVSFRRHLPYLEKLIAGHRGIISRKVHWGECIPQIAIYIQKCLSEERKDLKSELSNLLALIHRDGGHHEQKVGTVQSIKDAEEVVKKLREGYIFLRAKITEE